MPELYKIIVNGTMHEVSSDPQMSLLTFLREKLGLCGAKNGCSGKGQCGACTVIINGQAKRACLGKMDRLNGAVVETIEGLAKGEQLHPLQQAFIDEGAVQCGFCTPGMIMAGKALLDAVPDPTDEEIRQALRHNFCRCTGYVRIIAAVKKAAVLLNNGPADQQPPGGKHGEKTLVRKDVGPKVTGKAVYANDIHLEKMLYGKLLFSRYPYAEIVKIDTTEARNMEGVAAVLTAADIPGRKVFGLFVPQQQVMAEEKVYYTGDTVAVVFAETEAQAEQAVNKIRVDYRPLPGVFSPLDAMKDDAPRIHEGNNTMQHVKVRKGDIDKAFARADIVIEGNYHTPMIEHAYLEPESSVSFFDTDGVLTVYTGSQSSFAMRDMIAKSLNLPEEKVRVILATTGGAFGGKEEPSIQIHCALGTLVTGRPVKLTLSREESIRISTKRHAEYIYMRHGATRDGKLVTFESRAVCDAGAYISLTPAVVFRSGVVSAGPYEIPNVKSDSFGVYTNNNPGGAFRGFGSTQVAFASEVQMDKLAHALNIDPLEFRLKNALANGKETMTGQVLRTGVGYEQTLLAVKDKLKSLNYRPGPGKKIGIGIASSYKNVGIGTGKTDGAGAALELLANGRVLVKIGATENGQGSDTAMAIIAARETGIDYDQIDVLSSDTRYTPDGGETTASRQTYVTGNAVLTAAHLFKEKLLTVAAAEFRKNPADLVINERGVADPGSEQYLSLAAIYQRAVAKNEKITAFYFYAPPETFPLRDLADHQPGVDLKEYDIHWAYCFCTQAAVVEVDENSGEVKVLKVIAAQDTGKVINPQSTYGQIEGAVMMGLGYALQEEFRQDQGMIATGNLIKLGVPFIDRALEIDTVIVDNEQPEGPFGAKGMGEVPINPTAPAIINAIHDAVGVWIEDLPATKEKVLAALKTANLSKL